MKTKLFFAITTLIVIGVNSLQKANAQAAKRDLSNLISPTSVNEDLLPSGDSTKNIGLSSNSWRNGFFYQLKLRKNKSGSGSVVNPNGIEFGYGVAGKQVDAGKIGYALATPNTLDIVGGGNGNLTRAIKFWAEGGATFSGKVGIEKNNVLELGYGITGKQIDAGKIGYGLATPNTLDIVGGGNSASTRAIKFWSEGGATFAGKVGIEKNNVLELGYGIAGKQIDAGKIGYGLATPNTLDIVGGGNSNSTRAIKFWAEGGATFIGNVGIGKSPFYKLDVCGTIRSKEVIVQIGWCDYVFDEAYKLRPLSEVEQFIRENKHLPNIPSATEVENNGLKVADMSAKLMEKIEELTLYVIQQEKAINNLQEQNNQLKTKLNSLFEKTWR